MDIILNGQTIKIDEKTTLAALIQQECPNPKCVIAEVNEKIIKREGWDACEIQNNDSIELVTLVGGG